MGYTSSGSGEIDSTLLEYKKTKETTGYTTKEIKGEVVFTAKNGLGVNLGGTEYQKRIKSKLGFTKRFSEISSGNKMSGIEIINPKVKSEIYYQKLTGASGAIGEGNYKIVSTDLLNNKGLSGSISCRQMRVLNTNNNINSTEADLGKSGTQQSYRKQIIITSTENASQNEINGQNTKPNVILNNCRTKDSKNSKNSGNSGNNQSRNQDSGNRNDKRRDIPNSGNGNSNTYDYKQKINAGKVTFNSRFKSESNQNPPIITGTMPGQNIGNSIKKEYEMKIKTSRDGKQKIITESKNVTETVFKKNKKTKNIEPLRDYDSQNNF